MEEDLTNEVYKIEILFKIKSGRSAKMGVAVRYLIITIFVSFSHSVGKLLFLSSYLHHFNLYQREKLILIHLKYSELFVISYSVTC